MSISQKIETTATFEKGIMLYYDKQFERAQKMFERVERENPEDSVAKHYASTCKYYLENEIPEDWMDFNLRFGPTFVA